MTFVERYRGFRIGETSTEFIVINTDPHAPYEAHGHFAKGSKCSRSKRDKVLGVCRCTIDLIQCGRLANDKYIRKCQRRLIGEDAFRKLDRTQKRKNTQARKGMKR